MSFDVVTLSFDVVTLSIDDTDRFFRNRLFARLKNFHRLLRVEIMLAWHFLFVPVMVKPYKVRFLFALSPHCFGKWRFSGNNATHVVFMTVLAKRMPRPGHTFVVFIIFNFIVIVLCVKPLRKAIYHVALFPAHFKVKLR